MAPPSFSEIHFTKLHSSMQISQPPDEKRIAPPDSVLNKSMNEEDKI